jgi:uncharacterized membrane protein
MSSNVAGALCYLCTWLTGLIFLLIEPYKNDKTVRFHAFQAIFFAVGLIALYIAMFILAAILTVIHLGILLIPVWLVLGLGIFATWIFLMFKAYNNQIFKLPIIGELAAKQAGL